MKTKSCLICNKNKSINKFAFNRFMKDKHLNQCNECRKPYSIRYRQDFPWLSSFYRARMRCKFGNKYAKRGIKFLMTQEEFRFLWNRDKAWLLKYPSIDRKNNKEDYILSNCRFIELRENQSKGAK